jgi:hypothetical protein
VLTHICEGVECDDKDPMFKDKDGVHYVCPNAKKCGGFPVFGVVAADTARKCGK